MTLVLPHVGNPEVSVVVVSHGAWALTERALRALADHTDRPFEVVVVDNASSDETPERLAELAAAQVIRNRENRGFGPANNQGAVLARGRYLVLLNTDAFVHQGWLDPLLDRIEQDGVGAVVPQYLNLDGSLQEAGVLLARDGTVRFYGEGEDPKRPWFRFARVVDSGSAACMLMRSETFRALRGFDETFAPAYYEDADLCMRLARQGSTIVYEPRSTVTHVRYGSGELEAASALSERNRRRFAERWSSELNGRPPTFLYANEQAVSRARDALANPRVLLCADLNEPGAEQLAYALLESFPRGRVTWAAGRPSVDNTAAEMLRASGAELIDDADASWLRGRLFTYDLAILGASADGAHTAALAQTQPQATRIALRELQGPADSFSARAAPLLAGRGLALPSG